MVFLGLYRMFVFTCQADVGRPVGPCHDSRARVGVAGVQVGRCRSSTTQLGNLNGMSFGLMITHSIHNLQQNIYRKGLNTKQAEFAVKIYKSHRQCRLTMTTSVELLLN